MTTTPSISAPPINTLSQVRVLIAEDDSFMSRLLDNVLHDLGFRSLTHTRSGQEALRTLKSPEVIVDLLICDWRMHPMDGLELTRTIRAFSQDIGGINPQLPIVMVTGCSDLTHVTAARDAGVTEYVIKPFTIKSLCDKLRGAIENPRPFIQSPTYRGPDRRRRAEPINFPSRRQLVPVQIAV